MKQWVRRARGAIGMGLAWAAGWAVAGVLIGVTSLVTPFLPWDAFFEFFDAPLPALAMPGFIGGVIFSAVLGVAGRRHRFDDLSLPRFAAWGALGGLLLSMVPDALLAVGLASRGEGSQLGLGVLTAVIAGPLMLLGAASAAGSLMLARKAQNRAGSDPGVGPGESQALLDAGSDPSAWSHSSQRTSASTTAPLTGRHP